MLLSASFAVLALCLLGAVNAHSTEDHGSETHTVSLPKLVTGTAPSVDPSAATAATTGCPTVTETRQLCSTCIIPACYVQSTLTKSCECTDEVVPTVYLDFPCDGSGCAGAWCTTGYSFVEPEESCRPVASVTDYLDTPVFPMPTFGNESASTITSPSSASTTAQSSDASESPPPAETVSGNAAGRMAIPFAGWF